MHAGRLTGQGQAFGDVVFIRGHGNGRKGQYSAQDRTRAVIRRQVDLKALKVICFLRKFG